MRAELSLIAALSAFAFLAGDAATAVLFAMGNSEGAARLAGFLNCLEERGALPKTILYSLYKAAPKMFCPEHLHILSAVCGFHGIPHSPTEIGHYKAIEIPFFLQYLSEQILMVPAMYTLIAVIRAHNAGCSRIHTVRASAHRPTKLP